MRTKDLHRKSLKHRLLSCVALGAIVGNAVAPFAPAFAQTATTLTPIKNVIIIIGENRSFDHVFATYTPVNSGETVLNLLSKGIVKADGTPGPNYQTTGLQFQASDTTQYQLAPVKAPYLVLPPALAGGYSTPPGCGVLKITTGTSCNTPANVTAVQAYENGLDSAYYQYLLTGGTGQTSGTPDTRVLYNGQGASHLPPGPYQLTNNSYPYDAYAASPVHRFFQMWQQLDCNAAVATAQNGWGCRSDLFPWVEVTIGAGSNGAAQPANFSNTTTGEGSTSMGFFNVQQGDVPYLKSLADAYSMSDNFHQSVNGGTGANHIMLGYGDLIWFSNGNGAALVPPEFPINPASPGTPEVGYTSALGEIENPDPQATTNNYYTEDGYGKNGSPPNAAAPKANYGGGSYVNCADSSQPGVPAVLNYLNALKINPNCQTGHYYLVNNYNPGYYGDGTNAFTDTSSHNTVFTIPPTSVPNIGDALNAKGVSWAYYGDQWNLYLTDKYDLSGVQAYCNICNPFQYATSIMTNAAVRAAHMKDTTDLYAAIANGTLPSVSYVKPSGFVDGHPSSSKLNLFEGFVKKIVTLVQANPTLWAQTAIIVTFDEGGGYWDSGYVQPLDFFGDGTRIPAIIVSPYSTGGHISHTYADHVSTLKFIEKNWSLGPITTRSRDNLPNPVVNATNPYVPTNSPAIGDLMDVFTFPK